MNSTSRSAAVVAPLAFVAVAAAQILSGPIRINDLDGADYTEPTIALGGLNHTEVICAAIQQSGNVSKVAYGISVNSGASFSSMELLDDLLCDGTTPFKTIDPSACASRSGDGRMWLGAVRSRPGSYTILVARKEPGCTAFATETYAVCHPQGPLVDKVLLAAGPSITPGQSRLYATYIAAGCAEISLLAVRSGDGGATWSAERPIQPENPPSPCDYAGKAPTPAVLDSGRLVVAWPDQNIGTFNDPVWRYENDGRPLLAFSDNEGENAPGLYWSPVVRIGEGSGIVGALSIDAVQIDSGRHLPSVAVDGQRVYVAFVRRASPASNNTDICIAMSENGGQTFLNTNIRTIADQMLHNQTGDFDQLMPAICVDSCGAVCGIGYSDGRDDPSTPEKEIDVYFFRILDFGGPNELFTKTRLTPDPFPATNGAGKTYTLGHYQQVAASPVNTHVWVTYVKRELIGGVWTQNFYAQKVTLYCPVDFNRNGIVASDDVLLFDTAHAAGEPSADLDQDGAVEPDDYTLFHQIYTSGACEQ